MESFGQCILLLVHVITTVSCNSNEVHLVNGSGPDDGRVEVCIQGEWSTVNDRNWDRNDAQVVCRELGYQTGCKSMKFASNSCTLYACNCLYSCGM